MNALVICIGNKARGDDGIGRRVAELLDGLLPEGVILVSQPQLDVVMAADIAQVHLAIFVDAQRRVQPAVQIDPIIPTATRPEAHALEPGTLVALAETLYGNRPRALLVSVAAPQMEHGESLSKTARAASEEAARIVLDLLTT